MTSQAIEERFDSKTPKISNSSTLELNSAPQIPFATLSARKKSLRSPPRLAPKTNGWIDSSTFGETSYDDEKKQSMPSEGHSDNIDKADKANLIDSGEGQHETGVEIVYKPQHLQDDDTELKYYRIIYRGVVALRRYPRNDSERSGAYVSYGEIIASGKELDAADALDPAPSTPVRQSHFESPSRSRGSPPKSSVSQASESVSSADTMRTSSTDLPSSPQRATKRRVIRVDKVLTGGYAVDATDSKVDACDKTPKRANKGNVSVVGPSPLPISDNKSISDSTIVQEDLTEALTMAKTADYHGYIFEQGRQGPVYIPIDKSPKCEQGTFLYKVVSSTPLPILTGPCMDAPKTKGMLIPGTIHEVCLRMIESSDKEVSFLRLTRRRGWIADRKFPSKNSSQSTYLTVMEEVKGEKVSDECSISALSTATSTVATPISAAKKRHRLPRRKHETKKEVIDLPPHVLGPSAATLSHPRYQSQQKFESPMLNQSYDKGVMTPSSNVSLLSDESSMEHNGPKNMTPDRSVARSTASSSSSQPSFFLMRVNAPHGLKILDAPHFQVNNLIHGRHPGHSNVASPMKELTGQAGNHSIFQTMAGGHHTTTLTSRIGNPAVFDSITKARKIPRGSVFEASKRIENSGAFSQGAGLIKLSDHSGWAIVPRQDELDEQYRSYSGSLTGIKEGEATRAYEEVGNAIVDERQASIYLRVLSKGGISVSLYPSASTILDDATSPTSSVAGSSAISGNGGQPFSQDSDVVSSVGSSFLDSMFRTPRKRDSDLRTSDNRSQGSSHFLKAPLAEKNQLSTIIPCGMCVEVEKWADPDESEQHSGKNEFARLRGGQGWIPRFVNGKIVADMISAPDHRFGSFWFRVQGENGIKVRLGPSRKAPSIKSDDGVYFRFERGEFLRASEVVTFFRRNEPYECFAKLYRNRHARLYTGHGELRSLASLTVQAEWVQVFGNEELYLEECATEPRIERHRQGWRYNVVLDSRIQVRKGPSFEAENSGVVLLGGESVLVNERVSAQDDTITWLRLKDGQGWVHNIDRDGAPLMIPHSLRHRRGTDGKQKGSREGNEDIAYNTIIARLFHNDAPEN